VFQSDVVEQVLIATHRWKAAIRRRSEQYASGGAPASTADGVAAEVREAEAALRAALAAAAERQKKAGSYRAAAAAD
jgi:hypothetical protein